jgi:hypothetical protein
MTTWLFRGLVFAALWTLERFVQGTLVNQAGTNSSLISIGLASAMAIPAFLWGLLDGRADAKDSPDPDRRRDLAMRWILAGVIAGMVSGVACLIISKLTVNMYAGSLFSELTTITAFSALVIFIPAIMAVSVGRWLVDRKTPYAGRRREEGHEGSIFDKIQRDDDFIDSARDTRYQDYAPGAVAAAEMASVDGPMATPGHVTTLAERAEDVTEEITKHVHEQAAKVEAKVDEIKDHLKKK